jgi:hypothetical protein
MIPVIKYKAVKPPAGQRGKTYKVECSACGGTVAAMTGNVDAELQARAFVKKHTKEHALS